MHQPTHSIEELASLCGINNPILMSAGQLTLPLVHLVAVGLQHEYRESPPPLVRVLIAGASVSDAIENGAWWRYLPTLLPWSDTKFELFLVGDRIVDAETPARDLLPSPSPQIDVEIIRGCVGDVVGPTQLFDVAFAFSPGFAMQQGGSGWLGAMGENSPCSELKNLACSAPSVYLTGTCFVDGIADRLALTSHCPSIEIEDVDGPAYAHPVAGGVFGADFKRVRVPDRSDFADFVDTRYVETNNAFNTVMVAASIMNDPDTPIPTYDEQEALRFEDGEATLVPGISFRPKECLLQFASVDKELTLKTSAYFGPFDEGPVALFGAFRSLLASLRFERYAAAWEKRHGENPMAILQSQSRRIQDVQAGRASVFRA